VHSHIFNSNTSSQITQFIKSIFIFFNIYGLIQNLLLDLVHALMSGFLPPYIRIYIYNLLLLLLFAKYVLIYKLR